MRNYSEDALVEQPAIALFARLGYETINAFHEKPGKGSIVGARDAAQGCAGAAPAGCAASA